jgi:hypothetical protein
MVEKCEMNTESRFIDVGSGLGKPNFHVAQDPGVRISIGIELEEIRWQLAMQNLSVVASEVCKSKIAVQTQTERRSRTLAGSDNRDGEEEGDELVTNLKEGVDFLHGDIFDVSTTVSSVF